MSAVEKLIAIAEAEVGYLEKASNSQLDDKTANAGSNNYTKYARDLFPSLQAQAWCDMFVDWCFVQAFGNGPAKQLLCGKFDAYTPYSAQYYKDKKQYHTSPFPGDQVFFKNATRICHTGIVYKVTSTTVYTIEGNTSSGSGIIANGGAVCKKSYALSNSNIDGYGRPDWSIVDQPEYTVGWNRDSNGWWYADTASSYYKSCWQTINGHRYYFNSDGYAVTNWQKIDEKWYYFEATGGHDLECALYVSDGDGAQMIGIF